MFTTHLVTCPRHPGIPPQRPEFALLCRDFDRPNVRLYWDQAVYKKPEKPRYLWHQDNGYVLVEPQQYLTLSRFNDATADNGCPQVAPRLAAKWNAAHPVRRPAQKCFGEPPDVAVAEVRAGGIVVFSSLTPHLTGPNTTDATRRTSRSRRSTV